MRTNYTFLESSSGLHPPRNRPDDSIITLAMGILTQAIRDLIRPQTRRERDWKEWKEDASLWVQSDESDFGSFHWVCSVIKADPKAVRRWIASLNDLSDAEKKSTVQMLLRLTYNGAGSNPHSEVEERDNLDKGPQNSDKLKRTA